MVSQSRPQVSIIIVTHNSRTALVDCLPSLHVAMAPLDCELVVVDNSSTDGSTDAVLNQFPQATIITKSRNCGFASACNLGAETACGEFLLFLNPDVEIDRDAIAILLSAARDYPGAGLMSGRLRFPDGSFQATCRQFPNISNMIFSRGSLLSRFTNSRSDKRSGYTLPDYAATTEVPAVAATMAMIRKELFDWVGGFDRRFFMFMEDTDLSLRLHQSDYANLFVPTAGGSHRWGAGSDIGRIRRLGYHHFSVWKYFLKHFPNGFSVLPLPFLLLLNFLGAVILGRRKQAER